MSYNIPVSYSSIAYGQVSPVGWSVETYFDYYLKQNVYMTTHHAATNFLSTSSILLLPLGCSCQRFFCCLHHHPNFVTFLWSAGLPRQPHRRRWPMLQRGFISFFFSSFSSFPSPRQSQLPLSHSQLPLRPSPLLYSMFPQRASQLPQEAHPACRASHYCSPRDPYTVVIFHYGSTVPSPLLKCLNGCFQ